jgi:hypothetical protein
MLDLMLGNALDAFSCGEISAWFRPWRTHHFKIDCACKQDPCLVWENLIDIPEHSVHATIFSQLGVNFVIDSSKNLVWYIDTQAWARNHGLKTVNILLWKNPIDLAFSSWKRGANLYNWRKAFIIYYSRALALNIPSFSVNFNELISNPQSKLAEICTAIDMPYFYGKEDFWMKKHHHLFGAIGTRKQVEAKNSKIKKTTTYHPGFQKNLKNIENQIESDEQVQKIIRALRKLDVSVYQQRNDTDQHGSWPEVLPIWYYRNKFKRKLQRYLPTKFDPRIQW